MVVISAFSPIQSINKKLNDIERKVCRFKSIAFAIINFVVFLVFMCWEMLLYAKAVCMGLILVAVGIIISLMFTSVHLQAINSS
ncbi:accessory gene regulator B family protein [bacterium]|nr:accessory gene regulator B family protein [Lachnospiraceae bacterium]MBP3491123.1 accessory gene regulator B family protein [bacterium]